MSIAFEAQYGEPTEVDVDGVRVTIDIGEALVSIRGLAATLRLGAGSKGESLVRRSLESGRRMGLISTRPARPKGDARSGAPRGTPRSVPRDAPPTIVRFQRHRDFLWPSPIRDAPADRSGDAPRDAQRDAIPVEHQMQQDQTFLTARGDARASRGRDGDPGSSREPERHRDDERDRDRGIEDEAKDERGPNPDRLPDEVRIVKEAIEKRVGHPVRPGVIKYRAETIKTFMDWIARDGLDRVINRCERFVREEEVRTGRPIDSLRYVAQKYESGHIPVPEADEQSFWRDVLYPEYVAMESKTPISCDQFVSALAKHKRKFIDEGRWYGFSHVAVIEGEPRVVPRAPPQGGATASRH
jgi:hypothetical protein